MLLRLIAQSHLDPVFMWPWEEGLSETIATCEAAANKLIVHNDLYFVRSDAYLYQTIARIRPDLLDRIQRLVRQGRWIPVGGWYTQADGTCPGGESLIRQALVGQQIIRRLLGVQSNVAYLPDSWGLSASLPKILSHCGFSYFVFARPASSDIPISSPLFRWAGDDGSQVLAYKIPVQYSTYANEVQRIKEVQDACPDWLDQMMCFFGVGNHGGGPTEEQIQRVIEFAEAPEAPDIVFSHPLRFFEEVQDNPAIPTYEGPIENWCVGTYCIAQQYKQLNDIAERRLLLAEYYSSLANILNGCDLDDTQPTIDSCWEDLLLCQFHDSLPGTAIRKAMEHSQHLLGGVAAKAHETTTLALQRIANYIDTSDDGYVRFLAFNPTSHASTFYFEYEPWLLWQKWKDYRLVDENGDCVEYQQTHAEPAAKGHTRLIIKTDLPPHGYRLFRVIGPHPDLSLIGPDTAEDFRISPTQITEVQGKRYRLTFDTDSNEIISLEDRKHSQDLNCTDLLKISVLKDRSDTWSMHLKGYKDSDYLGDFSAGPPVLLEDGPLRWAIERKLSFGNSTLRQEIRFYDESPVIEIHNWLDWHEQWKIAKMSIPLPFDRARVHSGIAFGHSERTSRFSEFPFHHWIMASPRFQEQGNLKGMAVLTGPGLHAADITSDAIRLSLVRSPVYTHEEISQEYVPGPRHRHTDQGEHYFTIGLLPIYGTALPAWSHLVNLAQTLVDPVLVATTTGHKGELPSCGKLLDVTPDTVQLTALKKAQNTNGYVIRLCETSGHATDGQIELQNQTFGFSISGNGILSLRFTQREGRWFAEEINAIESDVCEPVS